MQISITHDVQKITKHLDALQKRQVPYATSQAINDTIKNAQSAAQDKAAIQLDRPTKQTINAIRIRYANKRTLSGEVFILDWAWAYLGYQIQGGTRQARGKGTGVPTPNATLNQYGNIPSRKRGLVKKRNQFIATMRGISGVWERGGRGGKELKLIIAFERTVDYVPRFSYYKTIRDTISANFNKHFNTRLRNALATAR